jgi:hypothetical protein
MARGDRLQAVLIGNPDHQPFAGGQDGLDWVLRSIASVGGTLLLAGQPGPPALKEGIAAFEARDGGKAMEILRPLAEQGNPKCAASTPNPH